MVSATLIYILCAKRTLPFTFHLSPFTFQLLFKNVYRLTFALHTEGLAGVLLHKLGVVLYALDKDAVSLDFMLQHSYLALHLATLCPCAEHIAQCTDGYEDGADGYNNRQRDPEDIDISLLFTFSIALLAHYGICINLCVWIEIFH